jgi:hypothetical protein
MIFGCVSCCILKRPISIDKDIGTIIHSALIPTSLCSHRYAYGSPKCVFSHTSLDRSLNLR